MTDSTSVEPSALPSALVDEHPVPMQSTATIHFIR